MSIQELEAEALKLSEEQRAVLVERLTASLGSGASHHGEDPILGLGTAPVTCGTAYGSSEHDRYLHEPAK
jgi:hypothetical protein